MVEQRRVVGPGQTGWQRGDGDIGFVLEHVERHRQVEDRPGRLTGDHLAGTERAAVAKSLDLVADRLLGGAGPDEVRVQRVGGTVGVDRAGCGTQRLRDHLPTEESTTPRVAGGDADVGVGPVRFQLQEFAELDVVDLPRRHPPSVTSRMASDATSGRAATSRFRPTTSSTVMRPRPVSTSPARRNRASALAVDSLVAPIHPARSLCVSASSKLPVRSTMTHSHGRQFDQHPSGPHHGTVGVAGHESFVRTTQLGTQTLADRHRQVRLGDEEFHEPIGANHDHGRVDRCCAGGPGPTVERRQLTELVARRLDPDEQLSTRRHREKDPDSPLDAHVDTVRVIALHEQEIAGRVRCAADRDRRSPPQRSGVAPCALPSNRAPDPYRAGV